MEKLGADIFRMDSDSSRVHESFSQLHKEQLGFQKRTEDLNVHFRKDLYVGNIDTKVVQHPSPSGNERQSQGEVAFHTPWDGQRGRDRLRWRVPGVRGSWSFHKRLRGHTAAIGTPPGILRNLTAPALGPSDSTPAVFTHRGAALCTKRHKCECRLQLYS